MDSTAKETLLDLARTRFFWSVLAVSCASVVARFYFHQLLGLRSFFVMVLTMSAIVAAIVFAGFSLRHAWIARKRGLIFALLPLAVSGAGLLVPASRLGHAYDFNRFVSDGERVVEMIRDGTMARSETEGVIPLPEKWAHLTARGEVWVRGDGDTLEVYFARWMAIPFQECGYIYSPSGKILEDWWVLEFPPRRIAKNWYRGGRG